jgi:diguanylate cyclase (GGDEF)-like protein/PAS domain S-box-containing protein
MQLFAALTYWVIVALWLAVLGTVCIAYLRNPRTFGATRLLLAVLAIDTSRNIIENLYFGLYFGGQYGLFPGEIVAVLGIPQLLIIPKVINVAAACFVLGLLLLRWLPDASKERANAEVDLQHAEWRFKQLVDGVKEYAIYLLDPAGHVTSWNTGAERIKGYRADEILGASFARFYTEEDRLAREPERALEIAKRDGRFEARAWRVRKNGTRFWANVVIDPIRDDDGRLLGFAKVTKDITEQKVYEEKLIQLALFDTLTGLPNRVSVLKDLKNLLECGPDAKTSAISIAMIDLDGFKKINDTLGHSMGDEVLRQVARIFAETAQRRGQSYRIGGDEFILVLPNCGDPLVVTDVVTSLLKRLGEPLEIQGRRLFVGASAGIAIAPAHGSNPEELIENADLALYDAKKAGGRKYSLFASVMRARLSARQELDTELRRAHANKEFALYLQPQVRLSDGEVVGAEALLRWQHPALGMLAPAAFIETLAQSPVALQVGNWVLQTACDTVASWRANGLSSLRVGVNLFPEQFHDGMLLEDVQAALRHSGLPSEALELEITENIALGRDEETLMKLSELRKIGVGLSFDDFGTGYAALSYLTRYPLTRIKIDSSFVAKITDQSEGVDTTIVRAIITMAHNLGLKVTAEGIETEHQATFLRVSKCDEAQGFLYGKPMPLKEFEEFLKRNRATREPNATDLRKLA